MNGTDMSDVARRVTRRIGSVPCAIGCWIAIGIPFTSLPLLVVGIDGRHDVLVFLAILVVTPIALVLGRGRRSDTIGGVTSGGGETGASARTYRSRATAHSRDHRSDGMDGVQ